MCRSKTLLKLSVKIISLPHAALHSFIIYTATSPSTPLECARADFYLAYSAPTSAKFPERISKRLLRKVRNTHGDELFGRSRAHRYVKRVHRRHMRETATVVVRWRTECTYGRKRASDEYIHTRVHTCAGCNGVVLSAPANCRYVEITRETLLC